MYVLSDQRPSKTIQAILDSSDVLYALQTFDNVPQSTDFSLRFLDESKAMARFRRDRTISYEWLGRGSGVKRLVHHSQLGEWKFDIDFWDNTAPLERIEGRIVKVEGYHAATIELPSGLKAFFVPRNAFTERHINHMVNFYLGFSYDGPRAWGVQECAGRALTPMRR